MTSENSEILNLDESQVQKAVALLFQETTPDTLLEESQKILLQLTFKKIPHVRNKMIKLTPPTPIITATSDVCLFVKDLTKGRDYQATVTHFQDLLRSNNIKVINEIIPLKSLKTEYKPYEAKRRLSDRFDVHLADERIIRLLPTYLGKNFYNRKRHPVQVNLEAIDLKNELSRALNNTRCVISGRGSHSQTTVAHTKMSQTEVVENIMSVAKELAAAIPGGPINVKNLFIKFPASVAIPIYVSLAPASEVKLPLRPKRLADDEAEEITTVIGAKVKVGRLGTIKIIKDKPETKVEENIVDKVEEGGKGEEGDSKDSTEEKDELNVRSKRKRKMDSPEKNAKKTNDTSTTKKT